MTGLFGNAHFRKDLREERNLADSPCALRFDPAGRPGDRLTIRWNIPPERTDSGPGPVGQETGGGMAG